jgi:hypothetical protein
MRLISAFFLSSALLLSGCASLLKGPTNAQRINHLSIENAAYLDASSLFPLPLQGVFLQQLTTVFQDRDLSFSVHLTLSPQEFKAVAFNDIVGELYQLNWTPDALTWSASEHLPKQLKPENILSDFLLVSLPLEVLKKHLHGATVAEEKGLRIIRVCNHVVREIKYTLPLENFWEYIVLKNTKRGYQLTIQTVQLP